MAILLGNSRFCTVFANVFRVDHAGNCAVMCVSKPQPLSLTNRHFGRRVYFFSGSLDVAPES